MADRLYLYEHVPDSPEAEGAWLAADGCRPQDAALPIAVAKWGGLLVDDAENCRWVPLPGGGRVYWLGGCGAMVSTVPLPWMPETSRRGVVTLGSVK